MQLIEIDESNIKFALKCQVSIEQQNYVADSARILAKAYAYRKQNAKAWLLKEKEEILGIAMVRFPQKTYVLDQLLIDHSWQKQGLGTKALTCLLTYMKQSSHANKAYLCYIDGNEAAKGCFEKFGFRPTGQIDENEVIMEIQWDEKEK